HRRPDLEQQIQHLFPALPDPLALVPENGGVAAMDAHQRTLQDTLPRLLAYRAAGADGARDALDRQDAVLEFEFAGDVAVGGL
ncbi:MAG: hypothetical protein Q9194_005289, partial [Teloschistes cf. exilis]